MAKTELVFKSDVYDGDELIYAKGKKYLVTDEDDKVFYTGEYGERGIMKDLDAISFFVHRHD